LKSFSKNGEQLITLQWHIEQNQEKERSLEENNSSNEASNKPLSADLISRV